MIWRFPLWLINRLAETVVVLCITARHPKHFRRLGRVLIILWATWDIDPDPPKVTE